MWEIIAANWAPFTALLSFIVWLLRLEARAHNNTQAIKALEEKMKADGEARDKRRAEDNENINRRFDRTDHSLDTIQSHIMELIKNGRGQKE